MNKKKKTNRVFSLSFPNKGNLEGAILRLNLEEGGVSVVKNDIEMSIPEGKVQLSYNGLNRKKVITQLSSIKQDRSFAVDVFSFLSEYETVFVIDTNQDIATQTAITCFLQLNIIDEGECYDVNVYDKIGYFEFVKVLCAYPEKLGWKTLLDQPFLAAAMSKKARIALLVDSYLGEIDNYNNHLLPIFGDFYLPNNVTLLYATSDKTDTPINKLIKFVDSEANRFKTKLVSKNEINVPYESGQLNLYEKFRFISHSGLEYGPRKIPKSGFRTEDDYIIELWGSK